jgi:serine phosphatase RsbU (regulator of sigma subunit)
MLEVVAGRLASDLEREILLQEGTEGKELKRQLDAAERIQRNQLPTIPPMIQGWDLAGWTRQAQSVGGNFYDWFSLPKASVAFAVGDVAGRGIEAAVVASSLKASLRAHGHYHRNADGLLAQVNLNLWTGSAGDQSAALVCGYIEANTDRVRYGTAGRTGLILLRPDRWESLPTDFPPLGQSPESQYRQAQCRLQPGSALVIFSEGLRAALKGETDQQKESGLAESVTRRLNLPAKEIAAALRACAADDANSPQTGDRTILVLKRAGS